MGNRSFILVVLLAAATVVHSQPAPLFTRLAPNVSGVYFNNKLTETPQQNIITYEYFYNGGGVAIADFDNDSWPDIYFTANQQPNKLYRNNGNNTFTDVTKASGIACADGWKTGVTVADVNGDGFKDIYVCYSGDVERGKRKNKLLINNGNLTFTDKAEEMGVADAGYSTQAAFFDYDRDGDLDLFVLNHNIKNLRNFDAAFVKKMVDADAGDRLYQNENGRYKDVSATAGIIGNPLGYGLGLGIADINNDGWPDIYVSNDYVEEDYLYINNHNGTFTENLKNEAGHLSYFSMGMDIGDVNNDGWMDMVTLDMLPKDNRRQKLLYAPDNYELYNNTVANGFYHQLMRNMLQLNNGNNTFSEIGQLSGISNTDWSWSALLADYNNDGNKDLFVTNGYGRDMINRDFLKFYADERLKHLQGKTDERMFLMLQGIHSTPLHNYIYENDGNLHFTDQSENWGFATPDFSHGAAYADIDKDGDLDLVVNRMNDTAAIYINNAAQALPDNHYLNITLIDSFSANRDAIGATVKVFAGGKVFTQQQYPVHGFQSAMLGPLHIAYGKSGVDSVKVSWPDGRYTILTQGLKDGAALFIKKDKDAALPAVLQPQYNSLLQQHIFNEYKQEDNILNDFKIQPLMLEMPSHAGPRMAVADVNGDGLQDVYFCGAKGHAGALFLQQANKTFLQKHVPAFDADAAYEDANAVFFDADGDGDQDLYVVSSGYDLDVADSLLQDRLYVNDGKNFEKSLNAIPVEHSSGAVAVPMDIDKDGDLDLYVAGSIQPGSFPLASPGILWINNGKGIFNNEIDDIAPALKNVGMVTDAAWADLNGDAKPELIVAGKWMPIKVFCYHNKQLEDSTHNFFTDKLDGLWNKIIIADMDNDGDMDIVAGNWGTNNPIQVSVHQPADMYYGDFDNNGFIDPVICYYVEGKSYPMASRDEITDQMTGLRQRFPTYDAYAGATIDDILESVQKTVAGKKQLYYLHTAWFENRNGKFITHALPVQADFSPVCGVLIDDYNYDGKKDILLAGNTDFVRIKIGKMDANYGVLLLGDGKGNFTYQPQYISGLNFKGNIKDIKKVSSGNKANTLIASRNNDHLLIINY